MTKKNFFHYYNKLSGADAYLIFFQYNGNIYMMEAKHIAPRWTHEERESKKNGGHQKWKMYISKAEKQKLIAKAQIVMTVKEFNAIPYSNKGHRCEAFLHELYNLGTYTPDRVRFDKCGDVRINGVEYQVKFENASLCNVNTLHHAQADARKARK